MSATSTLRTIDIPKIGSLGWTYRLVDAEVSVWDGEIHCLNIGTVYRLFDDEHTEPILPGHLPVGLADWLTEQAEKYCLDHAVEIQNEIMTNRLAALLQHRPDCNLSADNGGRSWCSCGRDEERLGRLA